MAVGVGWTNMCSDSGAGASLSVGSSDTTPVYGDTITITVTPSGISPTSYAFTVVGNVTTTTTIQASNSFSYTVDTLNPTFYIQATNGSVYTAITYTGLTVSSITEAGTFITALETQTSDTMGGRQKDAVNLLVWMLQGNGTTNSTDLWTALTATNAVLYPYCPVDDSTASFDACKIDLLDPTHFGTFTNMVGGDLSIRGITGGTTKYFNLDVQLADFGQNSIQLHHYQSDHGMEYITVPMGVHVTDQNTNGASCFWNYNNIFVVLRVNTVGTFAGPTKRSTTGVLSFGRNTSTGVTLSTNGLVDGTFSTAASTTPLAADIYGHGFHNSTTGAVVSPTANRIAGFSVTPYLSANEYMDFCEAWDAFNKIVIPDGRKPKIG